MCQINQNDSEKKYQPISCDYYDHFEIHAMRKDWVKITFSESCGREPMVTKIIDLQTRNKEEYAILLNDIEVRLDQVIKLSKSKNPKSL